MTQMLLEKCLCTKACPLLLPGGLLHRHVNEILRILWFSLFLVFLQPVTSYLWVAAMLENLDLQSNHMGLSAVWLMGASAQMGKG